MNPDNFYNVYRNTFSNLDGIADDFQDDPQYAEYFKDFDADDPVLDIPDGANMFVSDVRNDFIQVTEDQYDEVNSIEERRIRLTENNLIFATNFTHTKTANQE